MLNRYDDAPKPNRRSIRLPEYDYCLAGAYFVTLCAQDRACIFGEVVNSLVRLSLAGQVAQRAWTRLPEFFERVELDAFVVMPNHLHAVLWIVDPNDQPMFGSLEVNVETSDAEMLSEPDEDDWHGTDSGSLSAIIQNFKSVTSRKIRALPKINKINIEHVWQRNYWERIIRNERELRAFRQYIRDNPAKWEFDQLNK